MAKKTIVIGFDQIYCKLTIKYYQNHKILTRCTLQLHELRGKAHFQNNAISIFQDSKEIFQISKIAKLKQKIIEEIENYLKIDNPIGCASSYKIERNARHLFKEIFGDVNAIAGISIQSALNYLHQNNIISLNVQI